MGIWKNFSNLEESIQDAIDRTDLYSKLLSLTRLPEEFVDFVVYEKNNLKKFENIRLSKPSDLHVEPQLPNPIEPLLWANIKRIIKDFAKGELKVKGMFGLFLFDRIAKAYKRRGYYHHMMLDFYNSEEKEKILNRMKYALENTISLTAFTLDLKDRIDMLYMQPIVFVWTELSRYEIPYGLTKERDIVWVSSKFEIPRERFRQMNHNWSHINVEKFNVLGMEDSIFYRRATEYTKDFCNDRTKIQQKICWNLAHLIFTEERINWKKKISNLAVCVIPSSSFLASTALIFTVELDRLNKKFLKQAIYVAKSISSSIESLQKVMEKVLLTQKEIEEIVSEEKWAKDAHEIHHFVRLIDPKQDPVVIESIQNYFKYVFASMEGEMPQKVLDALCLEDMINASIRIASNVAKYAELLHEDLEGIKNRISLSKTIKKVNLSLLNNKDRLFFFQAIVSALINALQHSSPESKITISFSYKKELENMPAQLIIENEDNENEEEDCSETPVINLHPGKTQASLIFYVKNYEGRKKIDYYKAATGIKKDGKIWKTTVAFPDSLLGG